MGEKVRIRTKNKLELKKESWRTSNIKARLSEKAEGVKEGKCVRGESMDFYS